jgi:hypothetical protein
MTKAMARASVGLMLLLAVLLTGATRHADVALAGDVFLASLSDDGLTAGIATPVEKPGAAMSRLPKTAQFRCPGGQLVFLSRACGCNGACCACTGNARYLNHCTCRCEPAPTPCAKGHSVGNP